MAIHPKKIVSTFFSMIPVSQWAWAMTCGLQPCSKNQSTNLFSFLQARGLFIQLVQHGEKLGTIKYLKEVKALKDEMRGM